MSVAASRAVLRQSQFMIRRTAVRHSSSSSEAANKAKESASNAASKAQQGLSRVTSSAGPAIAGAASNVGNALRKVGGRTGKVIAYIDSKKNPFRHIVEAVDCDRDIASVLDVSHSVRCCWLQPLDYTPAPTYACALRNEMVNRI